IVTDGGDYILAVKENQPHLHEDIDACFTEALETGGVGLEYSVARTEETNRGREEVRECHVITRPEGLRDAGLWKGLTAICMVLSHRVVEGDESIEVRYSIGSLVGTAAEYLNAIRGPWGIENPRSDDPRSDNLCIAGRAGYHRRGGPARAGRMA
ncbi:MAG: ISAs1 family transposase, partial [Planctomycetaceae bacterium]|nr:ISAs1 family transposase [Planctomycetaceae bacterium]